MKKTFLTLILIFICVKSFSQDGFELEMKDIVSESTNFNLIKSISEKFEDILLFIPNGTPMKDAKITSYYGNRLHPIFNIIKFHNGIDMKSLYDEKVYSTMNGIITEVGFNNDNGIFIRVSNHYGFETLYCHLSEVNVKEGEPVVKGNEIGIFGSTGLSTSRHLHYCIKKNGSFCNPLVFIGQN